MPSNKALGYFDNREAPFVDWDWAAPAIQAYSTVNDLFKVWNYLLPFVNEITMKWCVVYLYAALQTGW